MCHSSLFSAAISCGCTKFRREDGDRLTFLEAHEPGVTGDARLLVACERSAEHDRQAVAVVLPSKRATGGRRPSPRHRRRRAPSSARARRRLGYVGRDLRAPHAPQLAGIIPVSAREPVVEHLDRHVLRVFDRWRIAVSTRAFSDCNSFSERLLSLAFSDCLRPSRRARPRRRRSRARRSRRTQ